MSKPLPSPELLRKLLRYDPETGELFWRERDDSIFSDGGHGGRCGAACRWNGKWAGKQALSYVNKNGYKVGGIMGGVYKSHRVIWAIIHGAWPIRQIDHINGCKYDNRVENLRVVDHQENMKNQPLRSTNTSGVSGVGWNRRTKKWCANISSGGVQNYLGEFQDKGDAIAARKEAEVEYGFHENHGRAS